MRAGHFAGRADAIVKRGEAAFGLCAGHEENESQRSEKRANQGGTIGALRPLDKFRELVPVPDDILIPNATRIGTNSRIGTHESAGCNERAGLRGLRCELTESARGPVCLGDRAS